ncbi:GMC oxidoreductase-domain-containing protein [Infundibulicybe gibba]|nr:GMC oxidoreductase-domain-containing protein [Infundibulicybe gibba]
MQGYFKKLENNKYLLPLLAPDHGFDGWLSTNVNPDLVVLNPKFLGGFLFSEAVHHISLAIKDVQLVALVAALNLAGLPVLDLNTRVGVNAIGINMPSFTIDEHHNRSSVRERLLAVEQSSGGRLSFLFDTLATKVLLCDGEGGNPTAFGVEVASGAALAVAGNFQGKSSLMTRNITVRHEVIISAGTFQSPQLLSGIGEANQLSQHGIESVVNLPGVGNNLQDHDEVSTIWRMKQNFSLFDGCTFLSDPKDDPCLQFWIDSGHLNLYSFGGALEAITTKSSPELAEPDILTYFAPAFFRGFFRGMYSMHP